MLAVMTILQIVLGVLLTGAILLQAQGTGFGTTWSGGGETYHTRRGAEKIVFIFTIVGIIAFACLSLLNIWLRR